MLDNNDFQYMLIIVDIYDISFDDESFTMVDGEYVFTAFKAILKTKYL